MATLDAITVCNGNMLTGTVNAGSAKELAPVSPETILLKNAAGDTSLYCRFSATGILLASLDIGTAAAGTFVVMPNESVNVYTKDVNAIELSNPGASTVTYFIVPLDCD